jgi:hypothetical protein
MTAVVRIRFNETNYPMMVGDILLSTEHYRPDDFSIPTHDSSLVFPREFRMVPCGFRQKLAVLSDDLVVGWAGDAYPASQLIKKLQERNLQEPFTCDSFNIYLNSLDAAVWQNVELAGFIKEPNQCYWFDRNAEHVAMEIGEVALLGTGAEHIKGVLRSLTTLPVSLETCGNLITQRVLTTLSLTGALLSSEIASGSGLDKMFGAGYELATIVDGAFKKVADITYLFWKAWTDGDGVRIQYYPHRSLKISYLNDILVIRVDSITSLPGGTGISTDKTTCFFVAPIYRNVDPDELIGFVPRSLNSKFVCNYFTFRDRHRRETILAATESVGADGPSNIKFIEEGWQPKQFAIRDGYLHDIADRIRPQF